MGFVFGGRQGCTGPGEHGGSTRGGGASKSARARPRRARHHAHTHTSGRYRGGGHWRGRRRCCRGRVVAALERVRLRGAAHRGPLAVFAARPVRVPVRGLDVVLDDVCDFVSWGTFYVIVNRLGI